MNCSRLLVSIVILTALMPGGVIAYDDATTHPALAQETISFYNLLHPGREIGKKETEWIVMGSTDEDAVPRWMNHFYDPVKNEGWTGEHAGLLTSSTVRILAKISVLSNDPISAKQWVSDRVSQAALSRYGGDWSWERGLEAYTEGDEETAYRSLGHALHILEDMAVPEHTRNDTHAPIGGVGDDGSPYEDYAKRWTRENIRRLNEPNNLYGNRQFPVQESSVESYIDDVARYSNKRFFSKDTINDPKYELPKISEEKELIAYDEEKNPLAKIIKSEIKKFEFSKNYTIEKTDLNILSSYFSDLSRYAILNGAGVIELFLKQAEEYKIKQEFPSNLVRFDFSFLKIPSFSLIGELEKIRGGVGSLFASLVSVFSSDGSGDLKVSLVRDDSVVKKPTQRFTANIVATKDDADEEDAPVDALNAVFRLIGVKASATPPTQTSSLQGTKLVGTEKTILPATPQPVVNAVTADPDPNEHAVVSITEVMYDLPGSDSGREWIEIQNMGSGTVYSEELKFVEGGTSHRITFSRGARGLWNGGYAIITSNIAGFLEDNPSFSGNLFESSFSLNNSSEQIEISNRTRILNSVSYQSDWGGHGDGFSLQRDGSIWRASQPTPGDAYRYVAPTSTQQNPPPVVIVTTTTQPIVTATSSVASSIVISEIQVQGEDSGDEFIELYNPTSVTVDLSSYSVQYVSGSIEVSENTISKKNFSAGSSIDGYGFYLIARAVDGAGVDGYRKAETPDLLHRAFSMSAGSLGGKIFLVQNQDPISNAGDTDVADVVNYGSKIPPSGGSIERRARTLTSCVSPLVGEAGEFLGHGCDSGTIGDFETRAVSYPQGSKSLLEPRSKPEKPSVRPGVNSIGSWRKDLMSIDFLWSPSLDVERSEVVMYEIRDASTSNLIASTSLLRYRHRIWEVGRTDRFIIKSFDRGGFASDPVSVDVEVPGFLSSVEFYRNPKNEQEYLVDFHYPSPDFIPPIYSKVLGFTPWQALVGHLNRSPDPSAQGIEFAMDSCGGYKTPYPSIIFTTVPGNCSPYGGGLNPRSVMLSTEDNLLRAPLALDADTLDLWPDAYLTITYYDFKSGAGAESGLSFVASDVRRFPLRSSPPNFARPVMQGNISTDFNKPGGAVNLEWEQAIDADSKDSELSYEIYEAGIGDAPPEHGWIPLGKTTKTARPVFPNDRKTYYVRAKDETGMVSEFKSVSWEHPETRMVVDQWARGAWSVQFGSASRSSYSDPQRGSFQSVFFTGGASIDAVFVRLKRNFGGYGNANVRLSVYPPGSGGDPDFSSHLGEASASILETGEDGIDVKFSFPSPVVFSPGVSYWLVLDVTSYEGSGGFFSNSIMNALSTDDRYPGGEARSGWAEGAQPSCSQCAVDPATPDSPSDWYMKMVDE